MINPLAVDGMLVGMEFAITKRDGTQLRVLVSDEDADLATKRWRMAGGKGKVGKYVAGNDGYIHRIIAQRMGLDVPRSEGQGRWKLSIDHINGNKLDNRRENLRVADRSVQSMNLADGPPRTNRSGHRGVSLDCRTGKWGAWGSVKDRSVCLGRFDTLEEAIAKREEWERAPWSPPPTRKVQSCGTPAGYQRHRKNREEPCGLCREAINAYVRQRSALRRDATKAAE